ncbi:MAG: GAF domain-containing protein [Caldilineales bacterium]|nr:GAF domain-containing protein [Caldilineales bacterium]
MADDEQSVRQVRLETQLRRLVQSIEASGFAVMPHSTEALLNSIVEAAARLFGAAAASIALVNRERRTLDFVVSYGAGNEDVVGVSIPLGRGIAGYVAMTGQPMAVSNVQQDTRFDRSFAKTTGYVPNSILATPLISGDHVIGVMEVLDKIDADSFNMAEMELLALFANQAAIAVHQSHQFENIGAALIEGLKRILLADQAAPSGDLLAALEWSQEQEASPAQILALADVFNEIGTLGEPERRACLQILDTFAGYARSTRSSLR